MIYQLLGFSMLIVVIGIFWFIVVSDKVKVNSNLAKKIVQKEKMNSDDFRRNQGYYRDIIGQYSPALLSYIDDFNLDLLRDIIGDIIILEEKGYLRIEKGILINEIENRKGIKLTEIQKYILQNIENGNLIIDANDIKQLIEREGIEKQLLTKKIKKKNSKFSEIAFLLFLMLFIPSILEYAFDIYVGFLDIMCGLLVIILIAVCIIHFSYTIEVSKDSFYRTEKGNEINKKLEGLKDFLRDYGDMKSKEAEMITLWDDYLIYAIIFHQNDIAMSKYKKYIKTQKKKLKVSL